MKKIILMSIFGMITVGCAQIETVKLAADHMVSRYCSTPELARAALRKEVGEALAPNSVVVNCAPKFDEFDNVIGSE